MDTNHEHNAPAGPMLPLRYRRWRQSFLELAAAGLDGAGWVLELGGGRRPTFLPASRPAGCHYVGLDISREELHQAPPGAYDETWVCDIAAPVPQLAGRFDLALSWQVLEHVRPLNRALDNIHSYLRPGGRFVATLSGTFSPVSLINQLVPARLGVLALQRLSGRDPHTVFPAYYDHCWHSALRRMLASWSEIETIPFFVGAQYFAFSKPLARLFLRYEDWALKRNYRNLATHYLIHATK